MARHYLPRRFVVQVYCLARQAERSLDAALFAPWSELAAYFTGERAARLNDVLGGLVNHLQSEGMTLPRTGREEVVRTVKTPGLIRHLSGPHLARWKKQWAFSRQQLCFIAGAFQSFLYLLKAGPEPARETIISLRMDFWACEYLIECRCHGMPELTRATYVEHFNQSLHVTPVKVSDLTSFPVDGKASDASSRGTVVQREPHR